MFGDKFNFPPDYSFNVDKFLKSFEKGHRDKPGQRLSLNKTDCTALCVVAKAIFSSESALLEIPAPTKVCGDIHGQWYDLMRIFQLCGKVASSRYLFLGDYVDRGTCSLETISLLLAYKIRYPKRIFLLRGNHESHPVNKVYGFYDEVMERFGEKNLFSLYNEVFDFLPLAAIIDGTVFCCHGGLSPEFLKDDITDLKYELTSIKRPLEIPAKGLICDLLWSDPIENYEEIDENFDKLGWGINSRGCSFVFSQNIVKQFLDKFKLELVVRAHQVVPDGYEFFSERRLVTLFSVTNYCGTFDNAAAVLIIEKNEMDSSNILQGGFHILTHNNSIKTRWTKRKRKTSRKCTTNCADVIENSKG